MRTITDMTKQEQIALEEELYRLRAGWNPFETEGELEARIAELEKQLEGREPLTF
jgi:hypothetical protein